MKRKGTDSSEPFFVFLFTMLYHISYIYSTTYIDISHPFFLQSEANLCVSVCVFTCHIMWAKEGATGPSVHV